MNYDIPPVVGEWYRRQDRPEPFQVVAYDAKGQTVDVEYFDGTLDEWPLEHWRALAIESCEAPQDWAGPYDNLDRDDLGSTDTGAAPENWAESIDAVEDELDRANPDQELPEMVTEPVPGSRPAVAARGKPKHGK